MLKYIAAVTTQKQQQDYAKIYTWNSSVSFVSLMKFEFGLKYQMLNGEKGE